MLNRVHHALFRRARSRAGRLAVAASLALSLPLAGCAARSGETQGQQAVRQVYTYDQGTVLREAERFFGIRTADLGSVIEMAFSRWGEPTGFIAGEEASGAFTVGLRYGHGLLKLSDGQERKVYWQGPSIGFDVGGNASKVFVLVYNLNDVEQAFQRYPGLDGSAYFIGGVGMTYHQRRDVVLAPIRLGVGWRLGANVGYLKLTRGVSVLPF